VATWSATSQLTVRQIAEAARSGAPKGFPAINRKLIGNFSWGDIPSSDGGKFDAFDGAPAWSARVEYRINAGYHESVAACDISVFDRGAHREITIDGRHSFANKQQVKRLLKGIVGALEQADPAIR
jgi:hypothetical protein